MIIIIITSTFHHSVIFFFIFIMIVVVVVVVVVVEAILHHHNNRLPLVKRAQVIKLFMTSWILDSFFPFHNHNISYLECYGKHAWLQAHSLTHSHLLRYSNDSLPERFTASQHHHNHHIVISPVSQPAGYALIMRLPILPFNTLPNWHSQQSTVNLKE